MTVEPQCAQVSTETVTGTIEAFTSLDQSGNRQAMTDLAARIGKEQPALLGFMARVKADHGDALGEAAVFYGTLVWAMFERQFGRRLPRLLTANLTEAEGIVAAEHREVAGIDEQPVHERLAPGLCGRQPYVTAKLRELMEEDVREQAIAADGAAVVYGRVQSVVEAFDAAIEGRRPGQNLAPVVREEPKLGRNDPCRCGSGRKFKRCHGATGS